MAWLVVVSLAVAGLLPASPLVVAAPAEAAVASDFDPGYIVSDENFYDGSAMSAGQVQAFLEGQVRRCDYSRAQMPCLRDYVQATPTMAATARCAPYVGAPSERASDIIAKVGAACGISQRALLVLLQKEQSLVTDSWPYESQYRHATGYSCPDTAPCDPAYSGFFYQVYWGAYAFQAYRANNGGNYRVGWNSILWHPNRECGSSSVYVRNLATAGLYTYTPYQPNAAALANLYGTGDGCSSYGNRNFWRLWTDWFGDPRSHGNSPTGVLNEIWVLDSNVAFWGWAYDPDAGGAPSQIRVTVNGTTEFTVVANAPNPAVRQMFPTAGINHGFGGTVPVAAGTTATVCLTIVNVGSGTDSSLGCSTLTMPENPHAPVGEFKEIWANPDGVHAWGWAADRSDLSTPVKVRMLVDGVLATEVTANAPYPSGPDIVPGMGANTAWGAVVPLPPGKTYSVCFTVVNIGPGSDLSLGCRSVRVPTAAELSPKGEVKEVWATPGMVNAWGWAIDPDALGTDVTVVVQIDSNWYATTANAPYPATPEPYASSGINRAWGASFPASGGSHVVCVYFLNTGFGDMTQLPCRNVTVPDASPVSKLMGAWASPGGLSFWGYAVDPDSLDQPVQLIIHAGDQWLTLSADLAYAPGQQIVPGAGPNHGYYASVNLPPGDNWLCVYALNRNAGQDRPPECVVVRTT